MKKRTITSRPKSGNRLDKPRGAARRGSKEAVLMQFGKWVGKPDEVERLQEEIQQIRDQELPKTNGRKK